MPTRVLTEEPVKKRKVNSSVDDKPPKKYTKTIKQEIKKEPIDFSDDDINDDDVMDIEDADKTAKINPKKRIMKTKKVKKIVKTEKDGKEKPKQKKKKKLNPPVNAANINIENTTTPAKTPSTISDNLPKSTKKTPKIKEKKPREKKPQKGNKKPEKPEGNNGNKNTNDSDSDSTVDESDAYETCGVTHCQRPSGEILFNKIMKF